MNERIRTLYQEARGIKSMSLNSMEEWEHKFAELIVRECIANVKDWEKDSRNHISYMLERHFGVEE